jgi:hypothetical protein
MWIFLEGMDKTGKSTIAQKFKEAGWTVIHESNPLEFMKRDYIGPSYFEYFNQKLPFLSGQNVIFDRSFFTEDFGYPIIYNRKPLLENEDIHILQDDFVYSQNEFLKIYLEDTNEEAHWARCVEYKEPLTRPQFNTLRTLSKVAAQKWGFEITNLSSFQKSPIFKSLITPKEAKPAPEETKPTPTPAPIKPEPKLDSYQINIDYVNKLEQGLLIHDLLNKRILPKNSKYDTLEGKTKDFLYSLLKEEIFNDKSREDFTKEEALVLKQFSKSMIEKAKEKSK